MTPWSDPETMRLPFLTVGAIGVVAVFVALPFDRADIVFLGLTGMIAAAIGLGLGG